MAEEGCDRKVEVNPYIGRHVFVTGKADMRDVRRENLAVAVTVASSALSSSRTSIIQGRLRQFGRLYLTNGRTVKRVTSHARAAESFSETYFPKNLANFGGTALPINVAAKSMFARGWKMYRRGNV